MKKASMLSFALTLALRAATPLLSADPAPEGDSPAGEEIAFRLDPAVGSLDLLFEPAGEHRLLALAGQEAGGADTAVGPAEPYGRPRLGAFAVRGGLGFTAGPETFLFTMGAEYFITSSLSLGPLMQFGFEDDWFIFAPSINVRWTFDLDLENPWDRLKPFATGGMGACYIDHDRRGDDEEWGFLINFGGGIEYYFTDNLALGTEILFNFIPDEAQHESFFFSWQVVTVRFLF